MSECDRLKELANADKDEMLLKWVETCMEVFPNEIGETLKRGHKAYQEATTPEEGMKNFRNYLEENQNV